MSYKVSFYALSDIGLVRQNNEDFWFSLPEENFFVLADGMGGHQAGEVAAKEAAQNLCTIFKTLIVECDKSVESIKSVLECAIQKVNTLIYKMGCSRFDLKGMGTTLCCIFFHPEGLIYAHVGDSRIYQLHNHQLEQLTKDHSLMRELIEIGELDEDWADDFIYKNIITKAIGTEPFVEPTIETTSLQAGDLILMCTDGLTDLLTREEIESVLVSYPEEKIACQLVEKAKRKGGYDNITVLLVKVEDKNYEEKNLPRS